MPDFNITEHNLLTYHSVMARAADLGYAPALGNPLSFHMDLAAANGANGNPDLDLDKLAAFDDVDFLHDVAGIVNNMNRDTGKLGNGFTPRCAVAS